jgi:ubiquinone/menaquinone biosynthesis C-methylase UbiE
MTFTKHMYRSLMRLQSPVIRTWYNLMSRIDRKGDMVFMNYGWAGLDASWAPVPLDSADESDRYCIQLYDRVAGAVDLEGRDVLEVGCGRGGGAAWMHRALRPNSMTGMDFAARGIEYCTRRFGRPGLVFTRGDAEDMPFEDRSFDAIVNVESSHCYGSMDQFLGGVFRLLRPGGFFLYTDYHTRKQLERLRGQIRRSGLELVEEEDISANVIRALELDDARKKALIDNHVPSILRRFFNEFAGMEGTRSYNASFRTGEMIYSRFVMQRIPEEGTSAPEGITADRLAAEAPIPR